MPEIIERRYLCDAPGEDGKPAQVYTIDDGRTVIRVLLCDDHAAPIREIVGWGQKVTAPRQPRAGGLSEQRLVGLIED